MGTPTSTNQKLDLIIDSVQEIKDMRNDVISLVEWKKIVNSKLDEPHECLKTADISELKTTVISINKFKWWFLGFLIMVTSTMFTSSLTLSKQTIENKSNIVSNKENIIKIDRRMERLSNQEYRIVE